MFDDSKYRFLSRDMFEYPDQVHFSILTALDTFIDRYLNGQSIHILSDYRPGDPRQHGVGRAIDFEVAGAIPTTVWSLLQGSKLFSGLGLYLNDRGAVSFHVDTRTTRTVDNPALWGDYIEHTDAGRVDSYTTVDAVLDMLKKNAGPGLLILLVGGYILWEIFRPGA